MGDRPGVSPAGERDDPFLIWWEREIAVLLSMTGFGESRATNGAIGCHVEIKSVNNRFLKLSVKLTDEYAALERDIEHAVRNKVRRGTVTIWVRLTSVEGHGGATLNLPVIRHYLDQLQGVVGASSSVLSGVLSLPGVVVEHPSEDDPREQWPLISGVLGDALERFESMRRQEGEAMKVEMVSAAEAIDQIVKSIETSRPATTEGYRRRLKDRIDAALAAQGLAIESKDLLREVAIFAERSDISEELTRLRSHLEQFLETLEGGEEAGRKLDFLCQEMYREANTIASKANDVAIARSAVDLKSQVEKVREIVQNVE